jgi:hypothetical protein
MRDCRLPPRAAGTVPAALILALAGCQTCRLPPCPPEGFTPRPEAAEDCPAPPTPPPKVVKVQMPPTQVVVESPPPQVVQRPAPPCQAPAAQQQLLLAASAPAAPTGVAQEAAPATAFLGTTPTVQVQRARLTLGMGTISLPFPRVYRTLVTETLPVTAVPLAPQAPAVTAVMSQPQAVYAQPPPPPQTIVQPQQAFVQAPPQVMVQPQPVPMAIPAPAVAPQLYMAVPQQPVAAPACVPVTAMPPAGCGR